MFGSKLHRSNPRPISAFEYFGYTGSAGVYAGGLGALDVKVDHNWVLAASHHDGLARFVGQSVDLLVRHVWRNIDEVAGAGFATEFKMISPPHARSAVNDAEDGF